MITRRAEILPGFRHWPQMLDTRQQQALSGAIRAGDRDGAPVKLDVGSRIGTEIGERQTAQARARAAFGRRFKQLSLHGRVSHAHHSSDRFPATFNCAAPLQTRNGIST